MSGPDEPDRPPYETPGWQPPAEMGRQPHDLRPAISLVADGLGAPRVPEPARHERGNLIGLAMVVGLLAFFLADGTPSGVHPVVAFFVAAGAFVVLFLGCAVLAVAVRRRREPRPAAGPNSYLGSAPIFHQSAVPRDAYAWGAAAPAGDVAAEPERSPTPAEELEETLATILATVERLLPAEADRVMRDLLRYVVERPEQRAGDQIAQTRPEPLRSELLRFTQLVDHAPAPLLRIVREDLWRRVRSR